MLLFSLLHVYWLGFLELPVRRARYAELLVFPLANGLFKKLKASYVFGLNTEDPK